MMGKVFQGVLLVLLFALPTEAFMLLAGRPPATGGGTPCSGTVGNTEIGTEQGKIFGFTYGADTITAIRFPIGCEGTVDTFSVYAKYFANDGCDADFYIYADDNGEPGDHLATPVTAINMGIQGPDWWDVTLNYTIPANTDYLWIALQKECNTSLVYREFGTPAVGSDTVYEIRGKDTGVTYGTAPDPWGTSDETRSTTIPLAHIDLSN